MIARIKNNTLRRSVVAVTFLPLLIASVVLGALSYGTDIIGDAWRCWKGPAT